METPFDPTRFLELAQKVTTAAGDGIDEAILRMAVGRCYYALFLTARAVLEMEQERSNTHHLVLTAVTQRDRTVGDPLRALFRLRKVADYDLLPQPEDRDWQENWLVANETATELLPILKSWQSEVVSG